MWPRLSVYIISFTSIVIPQVRVCEAQVLDPWYFCPGVSHVNCDAAFKAKQDECGTLDSAEGDTCNCKQEFINAYVK
jgi:hypothetical protein